MDEITFDKLLLKTAFCCMSADGNFDERELSLIKSMCEKTPIFVGFKFHEEVNVLVHEINTGWKSFLWNYFEQLEQGQLSEEEELILIDFAIRVIKADDQVTYAEIKFFKNIRHRLKISDNIILGRFPDIESYLEEDIHGVGFLDKITTQFFAITDLPKFELISLLEESKDVNEGE